MKGGFKETIRKSREDLNRVDAPKQISKEKKREGREETVKGESPTDVDSRKF